MISDFLDKIQKAIANAEFKIVSEKMPFFSYEDNQQLLVSEILHASRIFIFGNGGSQAIAQHIVNDLVKRCGLDADTPTNSALMSCFANDYSYEEVFTNYLKSKRITTYDTVIFISSSGTSPNIKRALEYSCNVLHINPILIRGMSKELPAGLESKINHLYLPSLEYGVIESATMVLLHDIVEEIIERQENA